VIYRGLKHTYKTKVRGSWRENHAVRGISLGIMSGECFGLLGPNGAGKTTTLSVLTGDVRPPTSGLVTLFGHDISQPDGREAAFKQLGVCPQVDPLWAKLSGREHLKFYGRIKGVPEIDLAREVSNLLSRLGFEQADADKCVEIYSGGMKRKLSLGIALIGNSPLLFLDEPSVAVDAGAKRHLWQVIKKRARNQTVVLTTHSMEEAEALCNRVAIQIRGQLRCIGTPRHLKMRYACGYKLEIYPSVQYLLSSSQQCDHARLLLDFLHTNLSSQISVADQQPGRCIFLMGSPSESGFTLGKLFASLQRYKQKLGIADYSLLQPSLEQVFLSFAREQEEMDDSLSSG